MRVRFPHHWLPAAVVCALAAHALVYRTLTPADGVHGYFGWYEPAVAALSVACLGGLLALVLAAVVGQRLGRPLRRAAAESPPLGATVRSLALSSLAVFLVQEAAERSIAAGGPSVPVLVPSQWMTLLVGIAAASILLALALRGGHVLLRRVLGAERAPVVRTRPAFWSVRTSLARRGRPLAGRFALRAPPLLSS